MKKSFHNTGSTNETDGENAASAAPDRKRTKRVAKQENTAASIKKPKRAKKTTRKTDDAPQRQDAPLLELLEESEPREGKKSARKATGVKRATKTTASRARRKDAKSKQEVSDVVSDKESQQASTIQFDSQKILQKIADVTLSMGERERRKRVKSRNERTTPSEAERFYSGALPRWEPGWMLIRGARRHNLQMVDAPIPLSAFTVVTGVSGSGKSTLVEDVLYKGVFADLNRLAFPNDACNGILGVDALNKVVRVDQSPIGASPNSNPATYTGLFELIRLLYSKLPESQLRGYTHRHFSFNVEGGRCEKCQGAGLIKVEMHFLADIWVTCDACNGKRYDAETLQVKYRGKSIADALETTCGEAMKLFADVAPMQRILQTLCDVGLDYLPLGQAATTLSGGEAQRVKLAAELSRVDSGHTLYVLDEPTTGLHFSDVRKLLNVLHRLVDLGNTVVVIEHNMDVIKNADWILDIGPEAGAQGGKLVFAGTPEQLLQYVDAYYRADESSRTGLRSYTGEALFRVFERGSFAERQFWTAKEPPTSSVGLAAEEEVVASVTRGAEESRPWELDGRRWHLEAPAKLRRWSSKILADIVEKLEENEVFTDTDWSSRTLVETRALEKSFGWFMRAYTSDEWLLKLKFRVPKNTFNRDALSKRLALKPLSEIDEIPLCGTQSRIKVENIGAWQELEITVFSYDEIDTPEFWRFLNFAVERFAARVNDSQKDDLDLTPWRRDGRAWHLSQEGRTGTSEAPQWPQELLEETLNTVELVNKAGKTVWNKRTTVEFRTRKGTLWAQVFTKNKDFICVQLDAAKGLFKLRQYQSLGFEPELDDSDPKRDSLYLRCRDDARFDAKLFKELLKVTYQDASASEE